MLEVSLNQSNNTMGLVPLRLTKDMVCQLLSVSRDKIDKLVKTDSTFPRPIKEGTTRQAAVYYDYQSIVHWWNAQVVAAEQEREEQTLVC